MSTEHAPDEQNLNEKIPRVVSTHKNTQERKEPFETVTSTIFQTEDKNGWSYFSSSIPSSAVEPYLSVLKEKLGEQKFNEIVAAKEKRDGVGQYHITIIEPPELHNHPELAEFITKQVSGKEFRFELGNIGSVRDGKSTAHFVCVASEEADALRAELNEQIKKAENTTNQNLIGRHNFHITLGFEHSDVYKNWLKNEKSETIQMPAILAKEEENKKAVDDKKNEIFETYSHSGQAGEGVHQLHKYTVYLKSGETRKIEVRNTRHLDSKFGISEDDVFEIREQGSKPLVWDENKKEWVMDFPSKAVVKESKMRTFFKKFFG